MNRTYWPGGLEADTEVTGLAELVIEGILIPVLAIPGVLGTVFSSSNTELRTFALQVSSNRFETAPP